MKDYFGYRGKTCVVTGASSGIGKATAETLVDLGAAVYALDVQDCPVPGIQQYSRVNLSSRNSIDETFAQLPDRIDKFFGIAGVSGISTDFLTTFTINFIANKYMVDTYVQQRLPETEAGAVAFLASVGGCKWAGHIEEYKEIVGSRRMGRNGCGAQGKRRRDCPPQPGLSVVQAGDQLLYENESQTVRRARQPD